jgi:predicted HicB family RNase H-like nuclease
MKETGIHPTSVRITKEMREALIRRAEADGRSLTNYIENVLRLHIASTPDPKTRKRPK